MATSHSFFQHLIAPFGLHPVHVSEASPTNRHPSTLPPHRPLSLPLFSPLLFDNNSSDARDHCANERTFLSWLRLSIYMAVVSVAIVISFHLKSQPSALERRISLPVGLVFWALSLACLASGAANYANTVRKYGERRALVQSGWKTQVVFTVVATSIVAACVLLLSTNARAS